MKHLRVLCVEDSEDDTILLMRELRKHEYEPDFLRVDSSDDLGRALDDQTWDLILTDHNMNGFSSDDVLVKVKQSGLDVPVIIVSGVIGEKDAVEAMKAGAHDYVMKGNLVRLVPAIERELRDASIRREKLETEKALDHLTRHDSLTNLVNRSLLLENLRSALVRTEGRPYLVAVLYVDLDRFKVVNDSFGHEIGDEVLIEVARRLRRCARYDDTIARYGGDEFILIIENIAEFAEAGVVAEMIIKHLCRPMLINGHDIYIGASVGISFSDSTGWSAEDLIKNADTAMYQAKSLGRNNYQFYTPDMDEVAEHRRYLELSLHKAMELNELELYFQPQIELKSGQYRTRGAEVLLRWQHGTLGLVPPNEFIDLLEETGLIIPVGEWVLSSACMAWAQWIKDGRIPENSTLAINISSYQFRGELIETVRNALEESGLTPGQLELEITEGTLMEYKQDSSHALDDLKSLGVLLSVDDFGTGYSSLAYLSTFPIDYLKIDKSFVLHLADNANDAVIAKTIIGLAHNLGLEVIAEGVENQEALEFLQNHDCDVCQGFYFAKPMPSEQFLTSLAS